MPSMETKETLRHIRDLAFENSRSPQDGYALIWEWATKQLEALNQD